VVAFTGLYLTAQIALPLRHFLYPGNVSWTEEGHRFSWHMKLRSKDGLYRFYVEDLHSGLREAVNQAKYLTPRQQETIATRPHLLRRFAHFLHDEYQRPGPRHIAVRVESVASLNGRPYQFLIDPSVDLAAVTGRPFSHAKWIVPLKDGKAGDYPTSRQERIERMRAVLREGPQIKGDESDLADGLRSTIRLGWTKAVSDAE
jgi:hypothetical protein